MTSGSGRPWSKLFHTGRSVGKSVAGVVTFGATLAGGLVALGVIGGSDTNTTALALAAQNASDAGSSRIALSRTLRHGSDTQLEKANGAFDYVAEVGYLDYTSGLKIVFGKPYVYERFPQKRVWCRYDLSALGPGFLFGALTGFKNDPAAALVNLEKSGEYEEKGTETLFGVETTRYAGRVDLEKLAKRVSDRKRREDLSDLAAYNDGRLPMQVWLGEDDLPRRINTSFSVPGMEYGLKGVFELDLSLDFSRFGVDVVPEQPPQSKTVEGGTRGCPPVP